MNRKKIIIIVTAMILIIVGIAAGMKYSKYHSEKMLAEQLELGERYLLEQDYEAAVLAFSKAIELEPRRAESYLKLADSYIGLGDYDSAIQALEKGYEQTADQAVQEKLDELKVGNEVVFWDDPVLERMLRQKLGLEGEVRVRDLDWVERVVVLGETYCFFNNQDDDVHWGWCHIADDKLLAYYDFDFDQRGKERGNVKSINVFRYFRNLRELFVIANRVTDISVIQEMHLEDAIFFANEISDLTPLDRINSDRNGQEQFIEIGDLISHN